MDFAYFKYLVLIAKPFIDRRHVMENSSWRALPCLQLDDRFVLIYDACIQIVIADQCLILTQLII